LIGVHYAAVAKRQVLCHAFVESVNQLGAI
jgi:hypothetical protein